MKDGRLHPKHTGRRGYIERTLIEITGALEHTLFADTIARQEGVVQTLDARLKVVAMLLLLIAVSLSHSLGVIAALYSGTLILAAFSKVPLDYFIRRIGTLMIIFTGLIALPALLMTPGPVWVQILPGAAITRTGMMTALFLILRVSASLALAALLVLTTRWSSVLKALGVLHVPDVVVLILGMTYRYIYLLLHSADDMFLSRKSRILRRMSPGEERHLMSATSGALLSKSLALSSDVYLAMQSRGFRYVPQAMDTFRLQPVDYAAGVTVLIIAAVAIWLGR